jgi:hypothetical protein
MKSTSNSSSKLTRVTQSTPAYRSTVAIAVSPERTNVSVPNTAETLVATGALLLLMGVVASALNEE